MFVKICAITRPEDAVLAADAGADAIGMIFAPSRRQVGIEQAREIAAAVRGRVLRFGVFRDHLPHEALDIIDAVGLDAAQIHGSETPAQVREITAGVDAVVRAMSVDHPQMAIVDDYEVDALHLDAPVPGSGVPFDWSLIGDVGARRRLILAGGLRPDTVAHAIETVKPWGVDAATGTEASFGVKDPEAVHRFVAEARRAGVGLVDPHGPLTATSLDAETAR